MHCSLSVRMKRSATPLHSGSPTYDGEIVHPSHFTSLIQASAMYCGPQSQRIAKAPPPLCRSVRRHGGRPGEWARAPPSERRASRTYRDRDREPCAGATVERLSPARTASVPAILTRHVPCPARGESFSKIANATEVHMATEDSLKRIEERLTRLEAALTQQAGAPGGFTPPGGAVVDPAPWGGGGGGWVFYPRPI